MKRDFDLIRALLLQFETKEDPLATENPTVEGFSYEMVSYHCRLLHDAGLLRCEPIKSKSDRIIRVLPFELTWEGHEFLAKIRSETTWGKIKSQAKDSGLSLSLSIVSEIASRFTSKLIENL